jgi:hypothetical protein
VSRTPFKNSQSTPLERGPYSSRVAAQEFEVADTTASDNYVLLGFRAGYALQASELNEVQEHFLLQQTLTNTMICNWAPAIAEGRGPAWGYSDIDTDRSDGSRGGLCPISPNMITRNSADLVTFKRGWYLVQIPEFTGVSEDSYRFKVWIYNNTEYTFTIENPDSSAVGYVGFSIAQDFVTEDEDSELSDNSAGGGENMVPGATRYRLTISGLSQQDRNTIGSSSLDEDDSPMAIKVYDGNCEYINGWPIGSP